MIFGKEIAPLCKGAKIISFITLPIVFAQVIYIMIYIGKLGSFPTLDQCDLIVLMMENALASATVSLGGVLFYHYLYKRETDGE